MKKIDKNDVLERFVSSVNSFHKKTTTAVKIFSLKLEEEIIEKEEENPEYTEWLEKKNMIKEGEVMVKLKLESGEEINAKLGSIIALSEKEPEKKIYKTLPGSEAVTEA